MLSCAYQDRLQHNNRNGSKFSSRGRSMVNQFIIQRSIQQLPVITFITVYKFQHIAGRYLIALIRYVEVVGIIKSHSFRLMRWTDQTLRQYIPFYLLCKSILLTDDRLYHCCVRGFFSQGRRTELFFSFLSACLLSTSRTSTSKCTGFVQRIRGYYECSHSESSFLSCIVCWRTVAW